MAPGFGDVPEEPPQELFRRERHALRLPVPVVRVREGRGRRGRAHEPAIPDRAAPDVVGQVRDDAVAVGIGLLS